MVNLPDIFTQNITISNIDPNNKLNKKFWLKIEHGPSKGNFFIIKKLSKDESEKVTKGLNYPSKFYFSDYGNIQGTTNGSDKFVILHALRINDVAQTANSLQQLVKKHENQFKYDYNNIITEDLKFILHKKKGIWYLLYNPVHRKEFKSYYENLKKSPKAKSWSGTSDGSAFIDTTTLFRDYCKSFIINKDPSFPKENAYMDPTCNMILSPDSCAENAFFGVNLSEYSYSKNNFKEVINTFTSRQKGIEPCLAWGPGSNFINESPLDATSNNSTSFITKFRNRDKYDSTMELNVCNSEISTAGNANLDGVNIQNTCGGGGVGSVAGNSSDDSKNNNSGNNSNGSSNNDSNSGSNSSSNSGSNNSSSNSSSNSRSNDSNNNNESSEKSYKKKIDKYLELVKENKYMAGIVLVVVIIIVLMLFGSENTTYDFNTYSSKSVPSTFSQGSYSPQGSYFQGSYSTQGSTNISF